MTRSRQTVVALADVIERYDRVVEVGIGRRPALAALLSKRRVAVTATDVHSREVPGGVEFVVDDVVTPDIAVYRGADALYAVNLPPELHRPLVSVARRVDADALFTTLGGDRPQVPVERLSLPGTRETLFVASDRPGIDQG